MGASIELENLSSNIENHDQSCQSVHLNKISKEKCGNGLSNILVDSVLFDLMKSMSKMEYEEALHINKDSWILKENDLPARLQISGELRDCFVEIKESMQHLRKRAIPMLENSTSQAIFHGKGMPFLDVRNEILLDYLIYLCYFVLLKLLGLDVSKHPVICRLIQIKVLYDKMKQIEQKLRYRIQKFSSVCTAQLGIPEGEAYKPNISDLLEDYGEREGNRDQAFDPHMTESNKAYIPPKLLPIEYTKDHIKEKEKFAKEQDRIKRRIVASEGVRALYASVSTAPEEIGQNNDYRMKRMRSNRLLNSISEREEYEENNMLRLRLTKRYKKEMRELEHNQCIRNARVSSTKDLEAIIDESVHIWNDANSNFSGNNFSKRSFRRKSKKLKSNK